MRLLKPTLAVTILTGLSACGGGGGGVSAPSSSEFSRILQNDEATVARIAGTGSSFPTTPSGNVPTTTGTVSYDGVGIVSIDISATRGVLMRGDANVEVAFASNTLSGSIENIIAVDTDTTRTTNTPVLVSEDIALTGGVINPALRNSFTLQYDGDLDVDGTDYDLGGTLAGQFRGTTAEALSATDSSLTNTTFATTIAIVAER